MLDSYKDKNAIVVALLQAADLAHLWSSSGPTLEALRLRDDTGAEEARRAWIRLAFELYDGSSQLTVAQLFATLPGPQLTVALTRLIGVSMGPQAVQMMLEGAGEDVAGGETLQ
jgi:hypothetical protein